MEDTQAVIDALQLAQLQLLQTMVIGFMVCWALFFIWLTVYFLRRLKSTHVALWQSLGEPTLWRKNGALLKFIMSRRVKELAPKLQVYARLLRYLTLIGVSLALAVAFAMIKLYWV